MAKPFYSMIPFRILNTNIRTISAMSFVNVLAWWLKIIRNERLIQNTRLKKNTLLDKINGILRVSG
jgi:hypothetical protein